MDLFWWGGTEPSCFLSYQLESEGWCEVESRTVAQLDTGSLLRNVRSCEEQLPISPGYMFYLPANLSRWKVDHRLWASFTSQDRDPEPCGTDGKWMRLLDREVLAAMCHGFFGTCLTEKTCRFPRCRLWLSSFYMLPTLGKACM